MTNEEEIELKKIVWAFMLEHGKVTNGEWSYYGSGWEASGKDPYDWRSIERQSKEVQQGVIDIGVDWEFTDLPEYEEHNGFVGTGNDSEKHECFLGTIVLNNRKKYTLGTKEVDEASKYAYDALKNKSDKNSLVRKYFG